MVFGLRLFGAGDVADGSTSSEATASRSNAGSSSISDVPHVSAPSAIASSSVSTSAPSVTGGSTASRIGALTAADSTPPDVAMCPALSAIPPQVLASHPELALTHYNLTHGERAANVLAIVHNAARLEMADMVGDILPCLQAKGSAPASEAKLAALERARVAARTSGLRDVETPESIRRSLESDIGEDDLHDLRVWWAGFARYVVTASLVEDMVTKRAFGDVYVGFRKETRAVEKMFQKVQEKNNVYLELGVKKVGRAVEGLCEKPNAEGVRTLLHAWNMLHVMLTDIFIMSEDMVRQIDRFGVDALEYKDLEKSAARVFTQRKRWGDRDEEKRGELVVILCRWMADEAFMRNWMARNLGKSDLRRANGWMDAYRANRLAIVDRFHHKRCLHLASAADALQGGDDMPVASGAEYDAAPQPIATV